MSLKAAILLLAVVTTGAARLKQKAPKQVLALDRDGHTKMLLQVGHAVDGPACEKITCADPLTCPPGFQATKVDGQCCPYCVNPDIKIEPEVTGATGKSGGEKSTFCPDVWCFPTMCTKKEELPTNSNGMCCPKCPT